MNYNLQGPVMTLADLRTLTAHLRGGTQIVIAHNDGYVNILECSVPTGNDDTTYPCVTFFPGSGFDT